VPGSLKKQKTSENLAYENRTLENMINNIISVNSHSQKQENNENGLKITKTLHENAFFSNSVESIKRFKENELNESMKYIGTNSDNGSKKSLEDIRKLEKELSDLMDKYSLMSNQICVIFLN